MVFTLIANCRMHQVEPLSYLKDILERLPRTNTREAAQLTPLNWKKARRHQLERRA